MRVASFILFFSSLGMGVDGIFFFFFFFNKQGMFYGALSLVMKLSRVYKVRRTTIYKLRFSFLVCDGWMVFFFFSFSLVIVGIR
jgi:hypothetical protein